METELFHQGDNVGATVDVGLENVYWDAALANEKVLQFGIHLSALASDC